MDKAMVNQWQAALPALVIALASPVQVCVSFQFRSFLSISHLVIVYFIGIHINFESQLQYGIELSALNIHKAWRRLSLMHF
jgi:hypothetical protein